MAYAALKSVQLLIDYSVAGAKSGTEPWQVSELLYF
jgi:hypothetical protein